MTSSFFTPGLRSNPFDPRLNPLDALRATTAVLGAPVNPQAQAVTEIGTKRTVPIGEQYYTGPRYGYQTEGAIKNLPAARASQNKIEQDYFRALQEKLARQAAEKPKVDQRGESTQTSTGQPTQKPAAQGTDPAFERLLDLLEGNVSPEQAAKSAEIATENYIKRALVTQALQLQTTQENTRRQVEVQNIQAWRDLERARIDANTRQALAFGQTIALAMVPNQGLMQGMNQAFANAMAPYEGFALKG